MTLDQILLRTRGGPTPKYLIAYALIALCLDLFILYVAIFTHPFLQFHLDLLNR
jgi:hypothetical protein